MNGFSISVTSGWKRRSQGSGFASWANLPALPPRSTEILVAQDDMRDDPPAQRAAWEDYLRKTDEG